MLQRRSQHLSKTRAACGEPYIWLPARHSHLPPTTATGRPGGAPATPKKSADAIQTRSGHLAAASSVVTVLTARLAMTSCWKTSPSRLMPCGPRAPGSGAGHAGRQAGQQRAQPGGALRLSMCAWGFRRVRRAGVYEGCGSGRAARPEDVSELPRGRGGDAAKRPRAVEDEKRHQQRVHRARHAADRQLTEEGGCAARGRLMVPLAPLLRSARAFVTVRCCGSSLDVCCRAAGAAGWRAVPLRTHRFRSSAFRCRPAPVHSGLSGRPLRRRVRQAWHQPTAARGPLQASWRGQLKSRFQASVLHWH
jgi:hypothetical protein